MRRLFATSTWLVLLLAPASAWAQERFFQVIRGPEMLHAEWLAFV